MSDTMTLASQYLSDDGYTIGVLNTPDGPIVTFENDTILGFIFHFPDTTALVENWKQVSSTTLEFAQFALRQAGAKSWNAYLILLADAESNFAESIELEHIEENLVGTRKIARAGVEDSNKLRYALLPLLSLRNAPHLEVVDMQAEIRLRTSDLPSEVIDGFLSTASDSVLIQILESDQ